MDVVMGRVSVLLQGRVLCAGEVSRIAGTQPYQSPWCSGGWDGVSGGLGVTHSLPPWCRHLQSATCKGFQHVKVDTLSQPEAISSVAVPGRRTAIPEGGDRDPGQPAPLQVLESKGGQVAGCEGQHGLSWLGWG